MYIKSTLKVASNKFHAVLGTFKTADFLWLVDPGTACRDPTRGAVQSLSLSFLGFFLLYINSFLLYIKNGSPYVAVKRPTLDREL